MFEKIQELVADGLGVDASKVLPETSFKDDLGADSLDLLELVMAFESEYGVEIPPEDLEGVSTVGDIMEYISKKEA